MAARELSLAHIVIKTPRIEDMHLFYSTLGIEFQQEQHGKGLPHYAGYLGSTLLELYPLAEQTEVDDSIRLGLHVDQLEEVLLALQAIGSSIASPIKSSAWGNVAVMYDPDGRKVDIYSVEKKE